MSRLVYADHAARSHPILFPVDAQKSWGNPSSSHPWGKEARVAMEEARRRIARSLQLPENNLDKQIIFTSGGTEGNNLVIQQPQWTFIITTATPGLGCVSRIRFPLRSITRCITPCNSWKTMHDARCTTLPWMARAASGTKSMSDGYWRVNGAWGWSHWRTSTTRSGPSWMWGPSVPGVDYPEQKHGSPRPQNPERRKFAAQWGQSRVVPQRRGASARTCSVESGSDQLAPASAGAPWFRRDLSSGWTS